MTTWNVRPALKDNDGTPLNFIVASDEREIAHVYNKPGTLGTEALANAKLIAAAPDLLDALTNLLTGLKMHNIHLLGEHEAEAAIAKAKE